MSALGAQGGLTCNNRICARRLDILPRSILWFAPCVGKRGSGTHSLLKKGKGKGIA